MLVQDLGRPGWAHLGVPRSGALDAPRRGPRPPPRRQRRPTPPSSRSCSAGWRPPRTTGCGSRSPARRARSRSTAGSASSAPRCGCRRAACCGSAARPPGCAPTSRSRAGSSSSRCWAPARPTPSDGSVRPRSRSATSSRWGSPRARRSPSTPRGHPPRDRCGCCRVRGRTGSSVTCSTCCAARRTPSRRTPTGSGSGSCGDPLPLAAQRRAARARGWCSAPCRCRPTAGPVVFLADHPTTGGYPVVAVVDARDLWQCAQLRPGEAVGFTRAARG